MTPEELKAIKARANAEIVPDEYADESMVNVQSYTENAVWANRDRDVLIAEIERLQKQNEILNNAFGELYENGKEWYGDRIIELAAKLEALK